MTFSYRARSYYNFLAKDCIFNTCRNAVETNTLHRGCTEATQSPYSCSMRAADQAVLGRKKAVAAVWNSLLHSTCQNSMAAEAAALVGLADWWYVTSIRQIVAPAEVKAIPQRFFPFAGHNLQKKLLDTLCSGVGKFIALQVLPVPNWPDLTWNKPFVFLQRNTRVSTWPLAQV